MSHIFQLNKVTDTLTALTSQHRADKKAWSLANQKLVNPLKHQELVDKVSKLEATNQRMQAILERNQLDTSKALTCWFGLFIYNIPKLLTYL